MEYHHQKQALPAVMIAPVRRYGRRLPTVRPFSLVRLAWVRHI